MSKSLWGSIYGHKPAETSPGGRISQDYFGLHIESNRLDTRPVQIASDYEALKLSEQTDRRRLNEGKMFLGDVTRRQIGHAVLYVAKHREHGLCVYVDQITSHANNRIEVLIDDTKTAISITRNGFFDNLSEDPLSHDEVAYALEAFQRRHIHMVRD